MQRQVEEGGFGAAVTFVVPLEDVLEANHLPIPSRMLYLWEAFQEIGRGRGSGFDGPQPLTWSDVHYWRLVTGKVLRAREIELVMSVDRMYLTSVRKANKK